LVIISTGEKEIAFTGIIYATNAQQNKRVDDIKVVFWAHEVLVCEDEETADFTSQLLDYETPVACKRLSDTAGISDKLKELGYRVEFVGTIILDLIKKGYVPMVF